MEEQTLFRIRYEEDGLFSGELLFSSVRNDDRRNIINHGCSRESAVPARATVPCRGATYPPKTTYLPIYLPKICLL